MVELYLIVEDAADLKKKTRKKTHSRVTRVKNTHGVNVLCFVYLFLYCYTSILGAGCFCCYLFFIIYFFILLFILFFFLGGGGECGGGVHVVV